MNYCSNCGTPLCETDRFCGTCGFPTVNQTASFQTPIYHSEAISQVKSQGKTLRVSFYMSLSILAMLFMLPIGAPAVIYAGRMQRAQMEQRYDDACKACRICRVLLIVSAAVFTGIMALVCLNLVAAIAFGVFA